jgi:hypothetical protein
LLLDEMILLGVVNVRLFLRDDRAQSCAQFRWRGTHWFAQLRLSEGWEGVQNQSNISRHPSSTQQPQSLCVDVSWYMFRHRLFLKAAGWSWRTFYVIQDPFLRDC